MLLKSLQCVCVCLVCVCVCAHKGIARLYLGLSFTRNRRILEDRLIETSTLAMVRVLRYCIILYKDSWKPRFRCHFVKMFSHPTNNVTNVFLWSDYSCAPWWSALIFLFLISVMSSDVIEISLHIKKLKIR